MPRDLNRRRCVQYLHVAAVLKIADAASADPRSTTDRVLPEAAGVVAGDTLTGIARRLWGDANLWYKLAEANGLSGTSSSPKAKF